VLIIVLIISIFPASALANDSAAGASLAVGEPVQGIEIGREVVPENPHLRDRELQPGVPGGEITLPGIGVRDRNILLDNSIIELLEISEPIPIAEFLASSMAVDLDAESRVVLEEAYAAFSQRDGDEAQYAEYEFILGDAYITLDTGEVIELEFTPASEIDSALRREIGARFEEQSQTENVETDLDAYSYIDEEVGILSIANLTPSNLRTYASQPLAFNVSHEFVFNLSNNGPWTTGIPADIFLDGNFIGSIMLNNIPANFSGSVRFNFGINAGGVGGNRQMVVFIGNRSASRVFQWRPTVQTVVLEALGIESTVNPIIAAEQNGNGFSAFIANIGNAPATTAWADFYLNGERVGSLRLATIQPNHVVQVTWRLGGINRSGSYLIGMRTWSPTSNMTSRIFNFRPDGCGLWVNRLNPTVARNIRISVNDVRINDTLIGNWSRQWNNITPNSVNISHVGRSLDSYTVYVVTNIFPDDRELWAGYFQANRSGVFTGGYISYNRTWWNAANENMRRAVTIHEVGHLLGLGHPNQPGEMGGNALCQCSTIMYYRLQTDVTNVTDHDRQALRVRFGYPRQ